MAPLRHGLENIRSEIRPRGRVILLSRSQYTACSPSAGTFPRSCQALLFSLLLRTVECMTVPSPCPSRPQLFRADGLEVLQRNATFSRHTRAPASAQGRPGVFGELGSTVSSTTSANFVRKHYHIRVAGSIFVSRLGRQNCTERPIFHYCSM